ncbi:hypothetical protein BMS3Abin12_02234 [bacterium BMS3Abin12]|nr:hypothetical protein BMS3Abin12_02234 [bacterium BMS3Abin12]
MNLGAPGYRVNPTNTAGRRSGNPGRASPSTTCRAGLAPPTTPRRSNTADAQIHGVGRASPALQTSGPGGRTLARRVIGSARRTPLAGVRAIPAGRARRPPVGRGSPRRQRRAVPHRRCADPRRRPGEPGPTDKRARRANLGTSGYRVNPTNTAGRRSGNPGRASPSTTCRAGLAPPTTPRRSNTADAQIHDGGRASPALQTTGPGG